MAGSKLAEIDVTAREIEQVVKTAPGVTSALAERLSDGRYRRHHQPRGGGE